MSLLTQHDVARRLGQRVRALRLRADMKIETLAAQAGVSEMTVRRFETTGRGSVDTLLRLASALGRLDEFAELLAPPPATSVDEFVAQREEPRRKRGRR
ncbi:helix-turn-helix domain-containing protein [Phytoactinopolyspora halotolerans]|uniref:Helix-turn-helix transcriptional regulator n=1 Tax=Phytoactinopolyspora halotolerans TaxID=1981512 RepID=A0A6L9S4J5_9ACTN|nr:helix-turn-helix transcriptional regulator [Phytoactinopolyspora halotolerans]NED99922.1 helix-turn-helix transcriptional regulator [Phytoactinopolyspora halotolerans]